MPHHFTLNLDIDEIAFRQHLIAALHRGGVSFQRAMRAAIEFGISRHLESAVESGACFRYAFKNGNQARVRSLQEAIKSGGFDFWYLDIQVDSALGITFCEADVKRPSMMRWLPLDYGGGVKRTIKFKQTTMKTRERCDIQILHPQVPAKVLQIVADEFHVKCSCEPRHLAPTATEAWNWQQTFSCILCGTDYLCECFRRAVQKSAASEEPDDVEFSLPGRHAASAPIRYRKGICHLCTGTPSDLMYCAPMYGSAIKVRYGAYMEKFRIEEGISPREAENKVRDILGVPRIGEGWINETQLYRLVSLMFADHEVLREARTDWLGNQRIDIYIPALLLAIEYQGAQHFEPVSHFGGEDALREAKVRDKRKRQLCKENGVDLVYFTHKEDLSVERVEQKLKRFLKTVVSDK